MLSRARRRLAGSGAEGIGRRNPVRRADTPKPASCSPASRLRARWPHDRVQVPGPRGGGHRGGAARLREACASGLTSDARLRPAAGRKGASRRLRTSARTFTTKTRLPMHGLDAQARRWVRHGALTPAALGSPIALLPFVVAEGLRQAAEHRRLKTARSAASIRGVWKRSYGSATKARQTKGAATDMLNLKPPRHTPTLRQAAIRNGPADEFPSSLKSNSQSPRLAMPSRTEAPTGC